LKADNEQILFILNTLSDKNQDKIKQAISFTSVVNINNVILRSTLIDLGLVSFNN